METKWLKVIGQCPLFCGLSDEALAQTVGESVEFDRGSVIYDEHTFQKALVILLNGTVEVRRRTADGRKVPLRLLSPGEVFGAAALFGAGERYVSEIVARERCRVCFVSQQGMSDLFARDPAAAERYITFLSDRIRFLNDRLAEYTAGDATERVYKWLVDHAEADGSIPLPQKYAGLARSLNIGRTSLYRALEQLEKDAKIRRTKETLWIIGEES